VEEKKGKGRERGDWISVGRAAWAWDLVLDLFGAAKQGEAVVWCGLVVSDRMP